MTIAVSIAGALKISSSFVKPDMRDLRLAPQVREPVTEIDA
jgi:hypothetical protein